MDVALKPLATALYQFTCELQEQSRLCLEHRDTTAVHTADSTLQVFRMFKCEEDVVTYMRKTAVALPSWKTYALWSWEKEKLEKIENEVKARMRKHSKLLPVVTRGIVWQGQPVLVHAYKFETDPYMKLELILPGSQAEQPEFALKTMAIALRCHEELVPEFLAKPEAPYKAHEAKFQTITEYLAAKMPEDLYTLCCFPHNRLNGD